MKVAIVGGGPGGLFLAALLRARSAAYDVTVFERNHADDTFGFGVVFARRTLEALHDIDDVVERSVKAHGTHWNRIEVRHSGEGFVSEGHGMSSVPRRLLLRTLQEYAAAHGACLRFGTEVDLPELKQFDLIVAADGSGSKLRSRVASTIQPRVDEAAAKFIWFGSDHTFESLTFLFERNEHGVFAAHAYPIGGGRSTFIVETDAATWAASGFADFDTTQPPGPSDERTRAAMEQLFARHLDGGQLLVNNSRWGNFRTLRCGRWSVARTPALVLLGDAAHTAHFSVGSGTKMALDDAVALADALLAHPDDVEVALGAYEASARPSVEAVQNAAGPSLAWWEHFGTYHERLPAWQFVYHFLTRSLSDARLARRSPDFVAATHREWHRLHGATPLASPLDIGSTRLPHRLATIAGTEAVLADGSSIGPGASDGGPIHCTSIEAPGDAGGFPAAVTELSRRALDTDLIAVRGGTPLNRRLLAEHARFVLGTPVLLIDPAMSLDDATTEVLAGRADLVARNGDVR